MISFNKKYAFEDFIDQFDAFMKANLGAYIDQMNLDKTDLVLTKPDPAAYFFQSLETTEVPWDIFVYYGETATSRVMNGPDGADTFQIQAAIIIANTNELQGVMGKRLLRYRECLRAMFRDGWSEVNKRITLDVSNISPFPFSVTNQPSTHAGIGVVIDIKLT